ncbi:cold-shock protein [Gammaproteobacteria bacterium]|nr:cold-shock protein [Gammaproteobacteria bacterium]
MKQNGVVKRFNKIKGYGFIAPENGKAEVFVHFSKIKTDGYKELKEGQKVKYIIEKGERGEFASGVEVI